MSSEGPKPTSAAIEAFLGSFQDGGKEGLRWSIESCAAKSEARRRQGGKVFFTPTSVRNAMEENPALLTQLQVLNSGLIQVTSHSMIDSLPPEIVNLIFDFLTDPDDRVMLALTSKTLAATFNHLTATNYMSSPSTLGLSPLAARVNAWVGPDQKYCRLCRQVKTVDRIWWA